MNPIAPPLEYGSVCSGIEAVTVAWQPLGLAPAWFAEIDPFPNAVLAHHYPHVPNLGDMTRIADQVLDGAVCAPDILVGGTPCQSFSVAGKRRGLSDPRGALTLKYTELANAIDHVRTTQAKAPAIIVWENVPGALSDRANAFGCFLGAIIGESCELQPPGRRWTDAGCVFGPQRSVAWRILDAQYFGVAQRRKRVFVVASARTDFDPGAVLFESQSLRRDSPPGRLPGKDLARVTPTGIGHPSGRAFPQEALAARDAQIACFGGGNTSGPIDPAACLTARGHKCDFSVETFAVQTLTGSVTHPLTASGCKGSSEDGSGRGTPIIAVSSCARGSERPNELAQFAMVFAQNSRDEIRLEGGDGQIVGALSGGGGKPGQGMPTVASVSLRGREQGAAAELGDDLSPALRASNGGSDKAHVLTPSLEAHFELTLATTTEGLAPEKAVWRVRRLMPLECERLQGLPDHYTRVPYRGAPAADGPRYKAIGNSMAVPCITWVGQRLLRGLRR